MTVATTTHLNLTEAETRYLRKCVRKRLSLRFSAVPRTTNGVQIPAERAKFLRDLAVSFTVKDY